MILQFPFSSVIVDDKRIIGEGAFSTVLKATNSSNTKYAIKKVTIQSSEIENAIKAEIESLQRFKHENIVEFLGFVESNDNNGHKIYFLAFPLKENGSLRNVLDRISSGQQPIYSLLQVFKDFLKICKAVNVLHTYNPAYIHQDIKPEVT